MNRTIRKGFYEHRNPIHKESYERMGDYELQVIDRAQRQAHGHIYFILRSRSWRSFETCRYIFRSPRRTQTDCSSIAVDRLYCVPALIDIFVRIRADF